MPHIDTRRGPASAIALIVLAALALSACGGSSGSSSAASASASTSTATSSARGGRLTALRECLQKDGITLPKRGASGQSQGGPGGLLGGGSQLPKGVTRAQFEAALKKCGGLRPGAGRFGSGGGARRLESPVLKAAIARFAACMRANGIAVPTPNTTGTGPIFDTKGLNTGSAAFKAGESKCSATLRGAFRGPPGVSPGGAG